LPRRKYAFTSSLPELIACIEQEGEAATVVEEEEDEEVIFSNM